MQEVNVNDRIRTIVEIKAEFSDRIIPIGTVGHILECYTRPREGYSIDLYIPGAVDTEEGPYENVTLEPDQFEVIRRTDQSK